MELDVLEYLKELRLWGLTNEAERKLYWVAVYIDQRDELQRVFEEWKEEDESFKYMCYNSYGGRWC